MLRQSAASARRSGALEGAAAASALRGCPRRAAARSCRRRRACSPRRWPCARRRWRPWRLRRPAQQRAGAVPAIVEAAGAPAMVPRRTGGAPAGGAGFGRVGGGRGGPGRRASRAPPATASRRRVKRAAFDLVKGALVDGSTGACRDALSATAASARTSPASTSQVASPPSLRAARGFARDSLEDPTLALDARNLDLLGLKNRVPHEPPASRGTWSTTTPRAVFVAGAPVRRRRGLPPRAAGTPSTRSRPASLPPPGPRRARPLPVARRGERRLGDDSDEERDALGPGDDAAGLSPEKRNPRPSGSGKHLGLSFSIFGTRRSRRRSEANPLQKMEQAKQEVCARGMAGVRARPPARGAERGLRAGTRRAQARGRARGFGFGVRRVARRRRRRRAAPGQKGKDVRERPRRPCIQRGLERGRALGTARASRTRQVEFAVSVAAGPGRTGGVLAAAGDTRRGVPRARGRGCRARSSRPVCAGCGGCARSADASMSTPRAAAAAAIRECRRSARKGAVFAAAAAAELAATDLVGVVLALEGGGATESDGLRRGPSPLLKAGVALMSLEEEHGESLSPPRQRRRRSRHHRRHLRRRRSAG